MYGNAGRLLSPDLIEMLESMDAGESEILGETFDTRAEERRCTAGISQVARSISLEMLRQRKRISRSGQQLRRIQPCGPQPNANRLGSRFDKVEPIEKRNGWRPTRTICEFSGLNFRFIPGNEEARTLNQLISSDASMGPARQWL